MIETKQQLIDAVRQDRSAWEQLIREIGRDNFEKPVTPEGWGMKDITAHLTTWRRWTLAGIEAWRKHEPVPDHPPQSDVAVINRWVHLTNHSRPLEQILRDDAEAWQQFEAIIASLPEDVLFTATHIKWLEGQPLGPGMLHHFADHFHDEHEPEIRAWLGR